MCLVFKSSSIIYQKNGCPKSDTCQQRRGFHISCKYPSQNSPCTSSSSKQISCVQQRGRNRNQQRDPSHSPTAGADRIPVAVGVSNSPDASYGARGGVGAPPLAKVFAELCKVMKPRPPTLVLHLGLTQRVSLVGSAANPRGPVQPLCSVHQRCSVPWVRCGWVSCKLKVP